MKPGHFKLSTAIWASSLMSALGIAATMTNAIAQYPSPNFPPNYPPPAVSPISPPPAVSPFNGTWKLQWRRKDNNFDGVLTMMGNSGTLTVSMRRRNGQVEVVQQAVLLQPSGNGFILTGQNPVYAGTNTPVPSYSPDSFFIEQARNLEGWSVKSCDTTDRCARVTMQYVNPTSPVSLPNSL